MYYIQHITSFSKLLLVIATIINVSTNTFAFSQMPIKMTLQKENQIKTKRHPSIMDEILKNAKICTEKTVAVDTIILNIYKINKFYINCYSPTITLSLKGKMENVYYITKSGETEKLLNTTSIVPNKLRNFFVYELDTDMKVDCIMYKS